MEAFIAEWFLVIFVLGGFAGGILWGVVLHEYTQRKRVGSVVYLKEQIHEFLDSRLFSGLLYRVSKHVDAAYVDWALIEELISAAAKQLSGKETDQVEQHLNSVCWKYGLRQVFFNPKTHDQWVDRTEGAKEAWPLAQKEAWG